MILSPKAMRYLFLMVVLSGVGAAFWWGAHHLEISHDVTAALPERDPVVGAAKEFLRHYPALENVFVDISLAGMKPDRDLLCGAGDAVSAELDRSGLAKPLTGRSAAETLSALMELVTRNLPCFFGSEDLHERVAPLIKPQRIEEILKERRRYLLGLDAIGQAKYLAEDPLGLRNIALERIYNAVPYKNGALYRGHILSQDGRHLLIIAEPLGNPQDADFARRLVHVLDAASKLPEIADTQGDGKLHMVYAGSFRAAFDNEATIREDASRALFLVTVGLILLLLLCFRRLWIGLLSAIPAIAGIMLATFFYALLKDSIFALSLGFGGALISIAVDHGLTYALTLDRPYETHALQASRNVWAVASVTVLTTVASLLCLTLTGIPLFSEVGLFAAMGVSLGAVFTHLFFPLLLPGLKGGKKVKAMPLERVSDFLERSWSWAVFILIILFGLIMTLFIRLQFSVDLSHMNTLRPETIVAERTLKEVWDHSSGQAYIMATGNSVEHLYSNIEKLLEFLQREQESGVVAKGLMMASALPGPKSQAEALAQWEAFWSLDRISKLEENLGTIGSKLGFKAGAFKPFLDTLQPQTYRPLDVPSGVMRELGIFQDKEEGRWVFVEQVKAGPSYDPVAFFERAEKRGFPFFDPGYFSRHIGGQLNASFVKMLMIIGGVAILVLFILIADWKLVAVAVLPLAFSLVATLGTLGILNRPLSIASLILAPILVGLGMDYGVYMVRSCQRFGIDAREERSPFRLAILMGGLSTLVGTASLSLSNHAVLRSAGLSTSLGIFYAMLGTFGLLPPLLQRIFRPTPSPLRPPLHGSREHNRLTLERFKHMEAYPKFFARFKIMLDPMFPRLADFVGPECHLLDIGCGYGVPSTWLVVANPRLYITACDPEPERARVAGRALGERATVYNCDAFALLSQIDSVDEVLLLDIIHYFSDQKLSHLLSGVAALSSRNVKLIIRVTVPGKGWTFQRAVETGKMRIKGLTPFFRSAEHMREILKQSGYRVELCEPTAPGKEETWFIARTES